jgi:hypothetical protein
MFCFTPSFPREACLAKPATHITAITMTAPLQVKGFKFSPFLWPLDSSNPSAVKPTKLAAFMATFPQQEDKPKPKPVTTNKLEDFLATFPNTSVKEDEEEKKIQDWDPSVFEESTLQESSPERLEGSICKCIEYTQMSNIKGATRSSKRRKFPKLQFRFKSEIVRDKTEMLHFFVL